MRVEPCPAVSGGTDEAVLSEIFAVADWDQTGHLDGQRTLDILRVFASPGVCTAYSDEAHPSHPHQLSATRNAGGWLCDVCGVDNPTGRRYRCSEACDFDVCQQCWENQSRGWHVRGAGEERVNGLFAPCILMSYRGVQPYRRGTLAMFRWQQRHWVIADIGESMDDFDESNWVYKVESNTDSPPLSGWVPANASSAAGPVLVRPVKFPSGSGDLSDQQLGAHLESMRQMVGVSPAEAMNRECFVQLFSPAAYCAGGANDPASASSNIPALTAALGAVFQMKVQASSAGRQSEVQGVAMRLSDMVSAPVPITAKCQLSAAFGVLPTKGSACPQHLRAEDLPVRVLVRVTAEIVLLRDGPGLSHSVVGQLETNQVVYCTRADSVWACVSHPKHRSAWLRVLEDGKRVISPVAPFNEGPHRAVSVADMCEGLHPREDAARLCSGTGAGIYEADVAFQGTCDAIQVDAAARSAEPSLMRTDPPLKEPEQEKEEIPTGDVLAQHAVAWMVDCVLDLVQAQSTDRRSVARILSHTERLLTAFSEASRSDWPNFVNDDTFAMLEKALFCIFHDNTQAGTDTAPDDEPSRADIQRRSVVCLLKISEAQGKLGGFLHVIQILQGSGSAEFVSIARTKMDLVLSKAVELVSAEHSPQTRAALTSFVVDPLSTKTMDSLLNMLRSEADGFLSGDSYSADRALKVLVLSRLNVDAASAQGQRLTPEFFSASIDIVDQLEASGSEAIGQAHALLRACFFAVHRTSAERIEFLRQPDAAQSTTSQLLMQALVLNEDVATGGVRTMEMFLGEPVFSEPHAISDRIGHCVAGVSTLLSWAFMEQTSDSARALGEAAQRAAGALQCAIVAHLPTLNWEGSTSRLVVDEYAITLCSLCSRAFVKTAKALRDGAGGSGSDVHAFNYLRGSAPGILLASWLVGTSDTRLTTFTATQELLAGLCELADVLETKGVSVLSGMDAAKAPDAAAPWLTLITQLAVSSFARQCCHSVSSHADTNHLVDDLPIKAAESYKAVCTAVASLPFSVTSYARSELITRFEAIHWRHPLSDLEACSAQLADQVRQSYYTLLLELSSTSVIVGAETVWTAADCEFLSEISHPAKLVAHATSVTAPLSSRTWKALKALALLVFSFEDADFELQIGCLQQQIVEALTGAFEASSTSLLMRLHGPNYLSVLSACIPRERTNSSIMAVQSGLVAALLGLVFNVSKEAALVERAFALFVQIVEVVPLEIAEQGAARFSDMLPDADGPQGSRVTAILISLISSGETERVTDGSSAKPLLRNAAVAALKRLSAHDDYAVVIGSFVSRSLARVAPQASGGPMEAANAALSLLGGQAETLRAGATAIYGGSTVEILGPHGDSFIVSDPVTAGLYKQVSRKELTPYEGNRVSADAALLVPYVQSHLNALGLEGAPTSKPAKWSSAFQASLATRALWMAMEHNPASIASCVSEAGMLSQMAAVARMVSAISLPESIDSAIGQLEVTVSHLIACLAEDQTAPAQESRSSEGDFEVLSTLLGLDDTLAIYEQNDRDLQRVIHAVAERRCCPASDQDESDCLVSLVCMFSTEMPVIKGNEIQTQRWATFRASSAVTSGRWYYEVSLLDSDKIAQIGFATEGFTPRGGDGVGDDALSWGYDGERRFKWHNGSEKYGGSTKWRQGDTIGCLLNLDAQTISFTRNGKDLGVAFQIQGQDGAFYAAASFQKGSYSFRFGEDAQFLPDGYQLFSAPPSAKSLQWIVVPRTPMPTPDAQRRGWVQRACNSAQACASRDEWHAAAELYHRVRILLSGLEGCEEEVLESLVDEAQCLMRANKAPEALRCLAQSFESSGYCTNIGRLQKGAAVYQAIGNNAEAARLLELAHNQMLHQAATAASVSTASIQTAEQVNEPQPEVAVSYMCSGAGTRMAGRCTMILCDESRVLSRDYVWDVGRGAETAFLIDAQNDTVLDIRNKRIEKLDSRSGSKIGDAFCTACGAQVGFSILPTPGRTDKNAGRTGIVVSALRRAQKTEELIVTFEETGTLGIALTSRHFLVHEIKPNSIATKHKKLRPGLQLTAVSGVPVAGQEYSEVLSSIRDAPRPLTLKFIGCPPAGAPSSDTKTTTQHPELGVISPAEYEDYCNSACTKLCVLYTAKTAIAMMQRFACDSTSVAASVANPLPLPEALVGQLVASKIDGHALDRCSDGLLRLYGATGNSGGTFALVESAMASIEDTLLPQEPAVGNHTATVGVAIMSALCRNVGSDLNAILETSWTASMFQRVVAAAEQLTGSIQRDLVPDLVLMLSKFLVVSQQFNSTQRQQLTPALRGLRNLFDRLYDNLSDEAQLFGTPLLHSLVQVLISLRIAERGWRTITPTSAEPLSVTDNDSTGSIHISADQVSSSLEKVKIRLPSSGRIAEEPPHVSQGKASAKIIGASSREVHASRAVSEDHAVFWESSGRSGSHYLDFELTSKCQVTAVSIFMDTSDRSFAPKMIEVDGGGALDKRIGDTDNCPLRNGWQQVQMRSQLPVDHVRIHIKSTHGGGTNCRIRGVKLDLKTVDQAVAGGSMLGSVTQDRFPIDRDMEAMLKKLHPGHTIQYVDMLRDMRTTTAATPRERQSSVPAPTPLVSAFSWECISKNPHGIAIRAEPNEQSERLTGPRPGDSIVGASLPVVGTDGWKYLKLSAPFQGNLGYVPLMSPKGGRGDEPDQPMFRLTTLNFHAMHGTNIELHETGQIAVRDRSYSDAVVFTAEPVGESREFSIEILKRGGTWAGSLKIGFTARDPALLDHVPADATDLPDSFILSGSKVYVDGVGGSSNYASLSALRAGSTVTVTCDAQGNFRLKYDGADQGIAASGLPLDTPLWGVVDVYGQCSEISLKGATIPVVEAHAQRGTLHVDVMLAHDYDRHHDASKGPLTPGQLGTIVQSGESRLFVRRKGDEHGRPWWYDAEALVLLDAEASETPAAEEPAAVETALASATTLVNQPWQMWQRRVFAHDDISRLEIPECPQPWMTDRKAFARGKELQAADEHLVAISYYIHAIKTGFMVRFMPFLYHCYSIFYRVYAVLYAVLCCFYAEHHDYVHAVAQEHFRRRCLP